MNEAASSEAENGAKPSEVARPWNGAKWIRPEKRLAIYSRDGFACAYCGARSEDGAQLTLDHLVSVERGGENHESNLVTCCMKCNAAKGAKSIRAWYDYLRGLGHDTAVIQRRVRRLAKRKIDKREGKRLLALRKERKAA